MCNMQAKGDILTVLFRCLNILSTFINKLQSAHCKKWSRKHFYPLIPKSKSSETHCKLGICKYHECLSVSNVNNRYLSICTTCKYNP